MCPRPIYAAVGAGAPPAGHVSGARVHSAGRPAAHEEEPGEKQQEAAVRGSEWTLAEIRCNLLCRKLKVILDFYSQKKLLNPLKGGDSSLELNLSPSPPLNDCESPPSPQSLQRELQSHRSRMEEVLEQAGIIASIRSPAADCIRAGQDQLAQLWALLWTETERRQLLLDTMYQVQQYYLDTAEVEAWLSEQELHMMNEEKGKVGFL